MSRSQTWTLTDVRGDVWLDTFAASPDSLHLPTPHDWSIRKRTLRGGLRDGIDLVELHNGALSVAILPTRGMGLWRGDYRGLSLGWLAGFDELLCRCGLSFNGPPGDDRGMPLTLHGRIANLPAQLVEVRIGLDPPYELAVTGEVEEACLFFGQLRLSTTYTTVPGSNRVVIHDTVQMLYHCNFGPPFLEGGSRILAPILEMAPQTPRAAEGIATYETCAAPVSGFAEQVYLYELLADARGQTLALLTTAAAERAVALRFPRSELPCFTVWKNTAALEDGYVVGLEPATSFPNFRGFERQQGRVRVLPPGGRWQCRWSLEVVDNAAAAAELVAEVARLQARSPAVVHRTPQPRFSPAG
jgi:hypothetical protein